MAEQESNHPDWRGSWVYVAGVPLTEHADNLLVSESRHSFEVYNRTDDELIFVCEYAHKLWKANHNGDFTEIVAQATKTGQITVPAPQEGEDVRVWSHHDQQDHDSSWNPFRQMDYTGQDGATYMLEAYTALRPDDADLRPDLQYRVTTAPQTL